MKDKGKAANNVSTSSVVAGAQHREDVLLTTRAAAEFLSVKPKTLETWRAHPLGPVFVRYSRRCVRYRLRDLENWLERHLVTNDETPKVES